MGKKKGKDKKKAKGKKKAKEVEEKEVKEVVEVKEEEVKEEAVRAKEVVEAEEGSLHGIIQKELEDVPKGGEEIAQLVLQAAKLFDQDAMDSIEEDVITKIIDGVAKLFPPDELNGHNTVMKVKVEPIYVWDDFRLIESRASLKEVIHEAKKEDKKLRFIGAGHSPTRAREGLGSDEAELKCILTGEFREMSYKALPVGENGEKATCCVAGAGMHILHDPLDPTSTVENGLLFQLAADGWALNDLGGITHQTIAGFMATGGSGGSTQYAFWDGLVEIEVMDGKGELHRFTNPEYKHHHEMCGNVHGFEAVGVSMGLMGVITQVTFIPTQLYWIRGHEYTVEHDDELSVVGRTSEGENTFRWEESSKAADQPYIRVNYYAAPPSLLKPKLRNVSQWIGQRMPSPPMKILPYRSIQRSAIVRFFAILGMKIGERYPKLRRFLLGLFSAPTKPEKIPKTEFYDIYWKALPMDNGADEDTGFRVDFTEIWIPQRNANEALLKLREAWDADPLMPGHFVTELYASKQSPFWLGMSHEEEMFRIDAFWYHYSIVTDDKTIEEARYAFYKKYWDVFVPMEGVTLHWGKYLPDPDSVLGEEGSTQVKCDQNLLRDRYKNFDKWLAFRKKMDPHNIFLTNYWKKHLFIPGE